MTQLIFIERNDDRNIARQRYSVSPSSSKKEREQRCPDSLREGGGGEAIADVGGTTEDKLNRTG